MINKGKIKVTDMVLIPQGVVMSDNLSKFYTTDKPFYAVVLEVRQHFNDGGSRAGNLLINYEDKQVLVDQEDVFKCS